MKRLTTQTEASDVSFYILRRNDLPLCLSSFAMKVVWMHYFLKNIMATEKLDKKGKRTLVASMPPGGKRKKHRIVTPNDAKMVLELVKVSLSLSPKQGAPKGLMRWRLTTLLSHLARDDTSTNHPSMLQSKTRGLGNAFYQFYAFFLPLVFPFLMK